ncbi:MAG: ABC transporter substrate-binding protein [Burkholderiales bacterium]
MKWKTGAVVAVALLAIGCAADSGDSGYGEPGESVKLVVGYQPYYTQAWSGLVMREKKFYENYLPKGSTVEFQVGLQGAIIVNQMLAGKQQIGYMGDMPAIVSTTKPDVADIRLVANLGFAYDQCNIFLAKMSAPDFADSKEAIKWLDGKEVAVPKGSCTDRFAQAVFKKMNITPKAYLNQNIEVITSNFRANKLDAAVIWEPTATRLIEEGLAKRMASGISVNENDAGFLAMRADLIKQRPDVVKGWLQAELDAQLFLADPKNAQEVAKMATEQTTGFSEKVLWTSAFGQFPEKVGGAPVRNELHYTFTEPTLELINRSTVFLHEIKSIDVNKLRPEAIMPEFTQEILKERGLTAPVGMIKAQPLTTFAGK